METVWNDLNGAERLNDWNDWNWLLSKIYRAIYTVFYRLINRLRRSDPEPLGRSHIPRGLKRNKKILTGTSVPLDTCLLMGDPLGGLAGRIR
jgi:hypothetical protein